MKRQYVYIRLIVLFTVFPTLSHAQVGIVGLLNDVKYILGLLPNIIFGIAIIFFFWGTGQFILNAGEAKLREDGKNKMIWGVVALAVYVSIYGILNLMSQLIN